MYPLCTAHTQTSVYEQNVDCSHHIYITTQVVVYIPNIILNHVYEWTYVIPILYSTILTLYHKYHPLDIYVHVNMNIARIAHIFVVLYAWFSFVCVEYNMGYAYTRA